MITTDPHEVIPGRELGDMMLQQIPGSIQQLADRRVLTRSLRYRAGELMLYRFPVDACHKADQRIGAQRDQREMQQERAVERHGQDVDDVGVKYVEKGAWP